MSAFVNDRDILLQDPATGPRNVNPTLGKALLLTVDPTAFHVSAAGAGTPSTATFTAHLINIPGVVLWSVTAGATLSGTADNVRTLAFIDMTTQSARVTATITYAGQAYLAIQAIFKVSDGATGSDAVLTPAQLLSIAKINDLVSDVAALGTTYGSTAAAATSASNAATASADAVAAKAAALVAAGTASDAATEATASKLAAVASSKEAGTSAAAAVTSASTASGYATAADSAAAAAKTAKIAAESAGGAAADSAAAAVTSRDTAVTKAGNAATSAAAASASATTASTKAANAATSATNAATSETNAAGSASTASTSATNAATSASGATGSATAAAGSASTAATQAGAASTSASSANTARVAAESARDAASGSATASSTSASSASTRASAADTSATAASGSATTAATRAADAATYRDSAASSASSAYGYAQSSASDYTAVYARLDNAGGSGVTVEQKLTAQADSIKGLSGQVVFAINNAGHVTGIKLASTAAGAGATGKVTIVADNFEVIGSGAAAKAMFKVGTVGGVVAVGIAGVGILDDAITARAIKVENLSAISADLGVMTAGIIQSGTTGRRSVMNQNGTIVYDAAGTARVQLGIWS